MTLARALLDALPEPEPLADGEFDTIEQALREMVQAGAVAWPTLDVSPQALATHIGAHLPALRPIVQALRSMHGAELYLAFACHCGDARAIAALEQAFSSHIDAVLSGLDGRALSRDDFWQIVRRKLFVADQHGPAKITSYAGHGSLAAWLRVTARRAGLNAIRGREIDAQPTESDALMSMPQSLGDPELDYLKDKYREVFRDGFGTGVQALPARERTLLRQTIVHRLTVRQVARMHGVHHATAARWVSSARQQLVDATRAAVMQNLDVSKQELDSIMALIASRLDVSVIRVLGPDDD